VTEAEAGEEASGGLGQAAEPPGTGHDVPAHDAHLRSRSFGHVHLLSHLSLETGLKDVLERAFPKTWRMILSLAFYSVCVGGSLEGFGTFARGCLLPSGRATASAAETANLISLVPRGDLDYFLFEWRNSLRETELEAFCSSPSHWLRGGGPDLRKVRLCSVFGASSGLPAGMAVMHEDQDSAPAFVSVARRASGGDARSMVMYGGGNLCSRENVEWLAGKAPELGFTLTLPETDPAHSEIIMEVLTGGAEEQSILASPDGPLIGFSKKTELWGRELHACVFLDRFAKNRAEDAVLLNALEMLEIARAAPERFSDDRVFQEALVFSPPDEAQLPPVEMRPDIIQQLTFGSGWRVELSGRETGLAEALARQGKADISTMAFADVGSSLRKGKGIWGEIVIAFTSLALLAQLRNRMDAATLFDDYTIRGLLNELALIRGVQTKTGIKAEKSDWDTLELYAHFKCPPPEEAKW
jgi:hypothetical protein